MKKVYYAHHNWEYTTPIEDFELNLLAQHFPEDEYKVINPRLFVDQTLSEDEIMKQCYSLLDECDCIAFSTVSNLVGHGVFNELAYAVNKKLDIFRIDGVSVYQETFDGFYDDNSKRALFTIVDDIVFSGDPRVYATIKPLITEV